jgi:hypothetical protein
MYCLNAETASVSWEYYYDPVQHHALTSTDPNLNPWWTILTTSLQKHFEISGKKFFVQMYLRMNVYVRTYIWINIFQ